jgi:membrane-bound inhibitor of C-type lysozyme
MIELITPMALAVAMASGGADTSVQIILQLHGDAERRIVAYQCDGIEPFSVEYLNADPNFFAIVPMGDHSQIFVAVLSASGAKYAAGNYVWWTKGPEADFYDLTLGEDAPPNAHCLEASETP